MISDQGGDEGRLSTCHLNRFGVEEEGGRSPPPPPPGGAAFEPTKPGGEKGMGTSVAAQSMSGVFLKHGGDFFRAELGSLADGQTRQASPAGHPPTHLPC